MHKRTAMPDMCSGWDLRFCKKRFFGENELWHHMERDHERCHLCKRAHPDRFVYFRDYAELEGTEHHAAMRC